MSQALLFADSRTPTIAARGRCMRCGRRLHDPKSVRCALGPECRRLAGLQIKRSPPRRRIHH